MIVRGCFDRTRDLNILFLHLMRALLMFNYDKPSRIFPCILLTRNHTIFLVQFGINKHLLIFSKTTNRARAILLVFNSCLFIPNCTRNHVITYKCKKKKRERVVSSECKEGKNETKRRKCMWESNKLLKG